MWNDFQPRNTFLTAGTSLDFAQISPSWVYTMLRKIKEKNSLIHLENIY